MKRKFFTLFIPVLLLVFVGYSQDDSLQTRNDKPGTPQSLRTPDQSPQSHATLLNSTSTTGQIFDNNTTGNSKLNTTTIITDQNTSGKVAATPVTNIPARMDSVVDNSAIRNGISNTTNPIRNK